MTFPVHTTKHMGSSYRKFNIISAVFTVITLVAALLAALSGIQLFNLQKKQTAEAVQAPPVQPPITVDDSLNKEIETIKAELANEKEVSQKLKERIWRLKKQKSDLEKSIAATQTPKPASPPPAEKPITPTTPEEATAPAEAPAIEPNAITPETPKPAPEIIPDTPKDKVEPSSVPQNVPLPDQPATETPPAPIEENDPPTNKPDDNQQVLEQPQVKQETPPEAEPTVADEIIEGKPTAVPAPDAPTAPVDQTPTAGSPDPGEDNQADEQTDPTQTPAQKSP